MKVFIPHKKDFNVYFDEIIAYSSHEFIFDNRDEYNTSFEIVNIHFPEAIFNWIPPTKEELYQLKSDLISWKQHSKLVLLFNDSQTHYDSGNTFKPLFDLINSNVDAVVHYGDYSIKKFKSRFPENCFHYKIKHPTYESLHKVKPEGFEKKFNFSFKDKYVVSALGNIRSKEEALLVLKLFKAIPIKDKILIAPNMFNILQKPKGIPYRFRKIYTLFAKLWYFYPLNEKRFFLRFNHISYELMVDLVLKTSLIIIPRKTSLNSGVLFLGLTFNKPMLIPQIGNLTEVAKEFELPTLKLEEALSPQVNNIVNYYQSNNPYLNDNKKKAYHPKNVASSLDKLLNTIKDKC